MSKGFPLQPLLDLSKTRLDEATRTLGELVAQENEGQRKLEMLQNYRAEYLERFQYAARSGMGPEAWRNYTAFMARIDEAIAAQATQLDNARQKTDAGKQQWMHERSRNKAFDTLQERFLAAEMRKQAKAEQRQADEHTANRHRRLSEEDG